MAKVKIIDENTRLERIEAGKGKVTYRYGDTFETDDYDASHLVKMYSKRYQLVSEPKPIKGGGN